MIIPKINFPFYGIIIVLSVLIGMYYIYFNLKKDGYKNKQILMYFIMYIVFAFVCGKMYTSLVYGEESFLYAGLSAYGGLVGVVISAIIFERIIPTDGSITKYTILSLPLVYGLTKIACSIVGCCGGVSPPLVPWHASIVRVKTKASSKTNKCCSFFILISFLNLIN